MLLLNNLGFFRKGNIIFRKSNIIFRKSNIIFRKRNIIFRKRNIIFRKINILITIVIPFRKVYYIIHSGKLILTLIGKTLTLNSKIYRARLSGVIFRYQQNHYRSSNKEEYYRPITVQLLINEMSVNN